MAHGGELLPGGCGAGLGRGEQEGLGWLVGGFAGDIFEINM